MILALENSTYVASHSSPFLYSRSSYMGSTYSESEVFWQPCLLIYLS